MKALRYSPAVFVMSSLPLHQSCPEYGILDNSGEEIPHYITLSYSNVMRIASGFLRASPQRIKKQSHSNVASGLCDGVQRSDSMIYHQQHLDNSALYGVPLLLCKEVHHSSLLLRSLSGGSVIKKHHIEDNSPRSAAVLSGSP